MIDSPPKSRRGRLLAGFDAACRARTEQVEKLARGDRALYRALVLDSNPLGSCRHRMPKAFKVPANLPATAMVSWASRGDIAARLGCSAPSVSRAAARLERKGLVHRHLQRAAGATTLWEVRAPDMAAPAVTPPPVINPDDPWLSSPPPEVHPDDPWLSSPPPEVHPDDPWLARPPAAAVWVVPEVDASDLSVDPLAVAAASVDEELAARSRKVAAAESQDALLDRFPVPAPPGKPRKVKREPRYSEEVRSVGGEFIRAVREGRVPGVTRHELYTPQEKAMIYQAVESVWRNEECRDPDLTLKAMIAAGVQIPTRGWIEAEMKALLGRRSWQTPTQRQADILRRGSEQSTEGDDNSGVQALLAELRTEEAARAAARVAAA